MILPAVQASLRILVAGFGTFPGVPYNTTPSLVARLIQLRRPALADAALIPHIFPVSYAAVDRELPSLMQSNRPDALLMFGLAAHGKRAAAVQQRIRWTDCRRQTML